MMEQLKQDFEKLIEQLRNEKENPALEQVIELRLNLKATIKQQESDYRNDVLDKLPELISDAAEQICITNQNNSHELRGLGGLVPRPMSECGAGKDAALQASVRTC